MAKYSVILWTDTNKGKMIGTADSIVEARAIAVRKVYGDIASIHDNESALYTTFQPINQRLRIAHGKIVGKVYKMHGKCVWDSDGKIREVSWDGKLQ